MTNLALIAEHHPAFAGNFGTPNLIRTICSDSLYQFAAIVSTDTVGNNPIAGPWDNIPSLALFRPRSLLPYKIGLGLLDNLAFRWQNKRIVHFLQQQPVNALFVLLANNPRLALFAANLPCLLSRCIYIVDNFVEDSQLYKVDKKTAQYVLDRLVLESKRVFTISPVYAVELENRYGRLCEFLPIPIISTNLHPPTAIDPPDHKTTSSTTLTLHHSGQIHHLYADALTQFISLLKELAEAEKIKIILEFWGNLKPVMVEKSLGIKLSELTGNLEVKLCGQVSPDRLVQEQRRANFLLLTNSFQPRLAPQVRCSFSSKICEYLISGVPILIYGPSYAGPVAHLSHYQAAFTLTTQNRTDALAQLKQILLNSATNKVVEAAINLAQTRHSLTVFFNQILQN